MPIRDDALDKIITTLSQRSSSHTTPLTCAAKANATEAVIACLRYGVDPNVKDAAGNPAVVYAVRHKNAVMLSELLEADANILITTDSRISLLQEALQTKCRDVIDLLLQRDECSINSEDRLGNTPVMALLDLWGSEDQLHNSDTLLTLLSILISKGADLNIKNSEGHTPLTFAAKLGLRQTIPLLIDHGGDINYCSNDNSGVINVFSCMLESGSLDEECLSFLLNKGMSPNIPCAGGNNPLTFLLERHLFSVPLAKLLLVHGANIHHTNMNKSNAFHLVFKSKDNDLISLLFNNLNHG